MLDNTYQAIEDNGGGLHLAVFDADDNCIYFHSRYEYAVGELSACIEALWRGEHPLDDGWDGNADDPRALYDELTAYAYGWAIVADEVGLYPLEMGAAAKREFDVDE